MVRRPLPSARWLLTLAVVSVGLMLALHAQVLEGSLVSDDYVGMFPRSWADLAATWTGSWHPWPMDRYYRPLAAYVQAPLFDVFGLHARLLHAAAFVPVIFLTWLFGVFLTIERNGRIALVGMALLLGSPLAIEPLVVPPFFVFQSAGAIVWMLGLLWWQHDRDRPTPRWAPLVGLTVVGVLFKEDTFMLLPTVVGLQVIHSWGDPARTPHWRRLLVWTLAVGAAVSAVRLALFPEFEAMEAVGHPMFSSISAHVVPHIWGWFYPDLDARLWPSVIVSALGFGALTQWRSHEAARRLVWIGGMTAVCAYLPLSTLESSHHSRAHLLALGSALAGAGAVDLWSAALRQRAALIQGAAAVAAIALWVLGPASAAREYASNFAYCEPGQLATDQALPDDAVQISPDVRDWAYHRGEACAAETVTPVSRRPVLRWGVQYASAWVDDRVFALWAVATSAVTLQVQHPDATPADPVEVDVSTAAGSIRVTLTSATPASVTLTFSPGVRSRLRDGHVMTVTVTRLPGSALRPGVRITGWPPVPAAPPVIKLHE